MADTAAPYLNLKVTGFRSLHSTNMPLKQGVNVLVGSNGSGKTNVIAATEFLSTFIRDGAHAAIAKAGGALRVFSNEQFSAKGGKPELIFSVSGRIDIPKTSDEDDGGPFVENEENQELEPLEFSYFLKLVLDKSKFEVTIDREQLSWRKGSDNPEVVEISASAVNPALNFCSKEIQLRDVYAKFMPERLADKLIKNLDEDEAKETIPDSIKISAQSGRSLTKTYLVFLSEISQIGSTLSFERSYNINPEKVREPEDIASSEGIAPDGSGTVTKLYELKRYSPGKRSRSGKKKTSKYDKIVNSFKQVNDQIFDFDVTPNLRTGRIDSHILFGSSRIKLPFEAISDGTAKWLAILTIIRSGGYSSYCIEEPENYLHPAAQRLFIRTLRNSVDGVRNAFYIVSTHSETIVNSIDVTELRLCHYDEDGTQVTLVRNPEKVKEALNNTGFGLGFLYVNERL